jgi:hypothetical protein
MLPLVVRLAAGVLLVSALWAVFRLAMGLREAKRQREQTRALFSARGQSVVAEIPLPDRIVFFTEDAGGFHWDGRSVARTDVSGARLLLNGGVIGSFSRPGLPLPEPPAPEEYEGRERWDVVLYLATGASEMVPCGSLREGVSREIATAVFEAVRREPASKEA